MGRIISVSFLCFGGEGRGGNEYGTDRLMWCSIAVELGGETDPYENHVNINVEFEINEMSAFDKFICSLVMGVINGLIMTLAPELAPATAFMEGQVEASCG